MSLKVSHGCWSGSYGEFYRWRKRLCEAAGYGDMRDYRGHGGRKWWPEDDALWLLLAHSDCEGEIPWEGCGRLADRLEELLPALDADGELASLDKAETRPWHKQPPALLKLFEGSRGVALKVDLSLVARIAGLPSNR